MSQRDYSSRWEIKKAVSERTFSSVGNCNHSHVCVRACMHACLCSCTSIVRVRVCECLRACRLMLKLLSGLILQLLSLF